MRHRMYPSHPVVYDNVFVAMKNGALTKLGNPAFNDTGFTPSHPLNHRAAIMFGNNNEDDGNGASVTVPVGYDTLWIRVQGQQYRFVHAYFLDGDQEDMGVWTGGYRSADPYNPDGSISDGGLYNYQWMPIPVGRSGTVALISKAPSSGNFWIAGLAFSQNPWNHAVQAAQGYWQASNGGDKTQFPTYQWGYDVVGALPGQSKLELVVPVIPSGRDKLLYAVGRNKNVNELSHSGITVEGVPIERFVASYDNPFARHYNNKQFERYIAARIPAGLVGNRRWISVVISTEYQDDQFLFREIGTHDYDIPILP